MLVTPELAQEWLDNNNSKNRNINMPRAKRIAAQISRGEWKDTSKTLGFDKDNQIADGQTRLKAIVLSGVPVQLHIVFDVEEYNGHVEPEDFRSAVDILVAHGYQTSIGTAAAIKSFAKFVKGTHGQINEVEVVDFYKKFGEEMDVSYRFCKKQCSSSGASYSSTFTVVHYMMTKSCLRARVDELFEQVLGGDNLKSRSKEKAAHKKIMSGELKVGDDVKKMQNKILVKDFYSQMFKLIRPKDEPNIEEMITYFKGKL